MFYVYVLKSKDYDKSYVGYTKDIQKRLDQHNRGKNSFTKKYKPWILIYQEEFSTQKDAIIREKYYKTHSGRTKLKSIFENFANKSGIV